TNPPTAAYAYGYVQSARAHNGMYTRGLGPAHHRAALHRDGRHPPHYPRSRSSRSSPSSLPPSSPARAHGDGKLMETVDYRYHDPPSRPRGAQQQKQQHHQQEALQRVLPPGFAIAAPALARSPAAVGATVSKCRFVGGSEEGDEEDEEDVQQKKVTAIHAVKVKRLGIMLSALRRACGLSKVAEKTSGRAINADMIV
ncbi:hypothetical protein BC826DRAFT_1014990, partial [Russula brevipes]